MTDDPDASAGRSPSAAPDRGGQWMLAWRDGDETAFDELVERYSGQVYALLTRFLGRHHPGREDLVQDVFLRVVRARDRYEPTARFSTWLYSIVWRMCINETERPRRLVALPQSSDGDERELEGDLEGPEAGLERNDVVRAVRTAIAALPDSQRIALVLARYHDLPYVEIAKIIGSSPKAVKSTIHRARETLRNELRPLFESEVA